MSFLWDSNILRHYLDDHPLLLENLKKVPRRNVLLPVIVAAEQFRGRMDALLKAQPAQLPRAQQFFRQTQEVVHRFELLYFDEQSLAVAAQLTVRSAQQNAEALRRCVACRPSHRGASYSNHQKHRRLS